MRTCDGTPRVSWVESVPRTTDRCAESVKFLHYQPGLCEEGADEVRFLSQSPDSEVEFLVQLVQISAHQVPHLDILQVVPAALVPGVQIRGITRQGLHLHQAARPRNELLALRPPMDRRAVPDHQQA